MRPLFTIHAGEYLVGSYIEKNFKSYNVWVPSKDSGVDLLITNKTNRKPISLQVKFSKDYHGKDVDPAIKSGGWWTFNRDKMKNSKADYWVLVLYRFQTRDSDFMVIPPKRLIELYSSLGRTDKTINSYLWVTNDKHKMCWETRDLFKNDKRQIAQGKFRDASRNWTKYLNKWPF